MRYLLTALAAAAALALGVGPALANPLPKRQAARAKSHISLHLSRHNVLGDGRLTLQGRVRPAGRHRVKIVVRGGGGEVLRAVSRRSGVFGLHWSPRGIGAYRLRAYVVHGPQVQASTSVARRLTSYGSAVASYYGPGLYGGALACGGTLQPGTLGVAHRTLPCGARVKLRYGKRSLTVRVVDRGPYAAGRDFDLTEATKARLGFPDLGVLLFSRGG
jgi:peptidoglycan lytic transglycosylase